MYLSNVADPATLAADGVQFLACSTAATEAYVTSKVAAGIKVYVYSVNDPTAAATWLGYGAVGLLSFDPEHTSAQYTRSDVAPFDKKLKWPGAADIGAGLERFARLNEYGLGREDGAGVSGSVAHRWAGRRAASVRVRWRLRVGPTTTTDMTRWVSMDLVRTPANQPFLEGGGMDQDGYRCLVRRNGDFVLYRMDDSLATSLGSNTADPDIAAIGAEGFADFQFTVTATAVTLTNLTTGSQVTSADTTYRLAGEWQLNSQWASSHAYLSNMSAEDLA
jgi:hypothetical protein